MHDASKSRPDRQARFALDALAGQLRWSAAPEPVEGQLRWASAKLHEVELGAASFALRSSARQLALRTPSTIGVLGGGIELSRFAWQPPAEARGTKVPWIISQMI